jgi:transposase
VPVPSASGLLDRHGGLRGRSPLGRSIALHGFQAHFASWPLDVPFRRQGRSGKNDANDAAAIFEAAGRPRIHPVPVKSVEQRGMLTVHRLRAVYKEERTAVINTIRCLAAEFGVVFP